MVPRSILITGCSSGIGLNAATILKNRGYRVFATARKTTDVEKLNSLGFESLLLDVNREETIESALTAILQKTGGTLDALFNNAGYLQAGSFEDLSMTLIRKQFETNFFGVVQLTKRVLPIMRAQGQGRIIQNSSFLGYVTLPYYGAYCASKYALEGFTSALRQELRGTNIFIASINPGPIKSHLSENAKEHYRVLLEGKETHLYDKIYQAMDNNYFTPSKRRIRTMKNPDIVTKALIKALESKRPRAHYHVGSPAVLFGILKRLLPEQTLDWLISKVQLKEG